MATKLHVGKCGPCHLYEQESTKYTHLEKMDCVVAELICDHLCKHPKMLITQLFSRVGSQNKPYLKLSVVLIRVTKLFTETRTWLLENLVGQKLVTFAI